MPRTKRPSKIMLINADQPEEVRVGIIGGKRLEEFYIEKAAQEQTKGNIYKGIVYDIIPSLQAAFVEYGGNKRGFLQIDEIHPEYFVHLPQGRPAIEKVLRPGQELLVQVVKEESSQKGAALTTYLALPGRYLVLTVGQSQLGISRKIKDEKERKRFEKLLKDVKLPPGLGLIIRTAAVGVTKTDLLKDLRYLLRLWESIKKRAQELEAPALVYREMDLVLRAIRDYFTTDIKEVWVDDATAFRKLKEFIHIVAPRYQRVIKHFKSNLPIFAHFGLEGEINQLFKERVPLPSGGEIVIQTTEALTAIDVNSSHSQERDLEETSFKTNLEAAEESARQIRLRNISGIIVIDFIQMRQKRHITQVEKRLKEAFKNDRSRVTFTKMSSLGLIEIGRQRLRPSLISITTRPCPQCKGSGVMLTPETQGLEVLRQLKKEIILNHLKKIVLELPLEVANYLQNQKRKVLTEMEQQFKVKITILAKKMEV